jgi:hypothetical protein
MVAGDLARFRRGRESPTASSITVAREALLLVGGEAPEERQPHLLSAESVAARGYETSDWWEDVPQHSTWPA